MPKGIHISSYDCLCVIHLLSSSPLRSSHSAMPTCRHFTHGIRQLFYPHVLSSFPPMFTLPSRTITAVVVECIPPVAYPGLAAHCFLIFQMSKDLQSSQWSQYDQILVNRQQSRVFANGESLISPFMAVVWPPNSPPFLKLQPQDPSRRGRLISTSATKGMMALPVTDLPAAMLIDANFVVRLLGSRLPT